jgi:N-acetylmuramic acid 6-phosphate etherase
VNPDRPQLDLLPVDRVVELLLDAESRVLPAVRAQSGRVAEAAELLAHGLERGGRLLFVGAGTSGRIAWAEAAELPGTFGLKRDVVLARVAGGLSASDEFEDDVESAAADLADLRPGVDDVLVAVAASGSTPYTMAMARGAKERGASVIAVVTVTGSPFASLARVAIEADVGPEVLRGSTRLGAGTAQKVALNAMTTAAMARLGRVHGDLMADVVTANDKLRERAAGVVAEVAGCDLPTARDAIRACGGEVRVAIVHVVTGIDPVAAAARAAAHRTLREALSEPS